MNFNTSRARPEHGLYYVYALCRPNGIPFYIGKGKNERINIHFTPNYLKADSHKNKIIKKYNSRIKREILAYFQSEDEAYLHEELLINSYGLESEGGLLTNYAKTRYEYSERFFSDVNSLATAKNTVKVSLQLEFKVLVLYYYYGNSLQSISDKTGLSKGVIEGIYKGKSSKRKLYSKYVLTGLIKDRRNEVIKTRIPFSRKIGLKDDELIEAHHRYRIGLVSSKEVSLELGCSQGYILAVFRGKQRTHLGLGRLPNLFNKKYCEKHNIKHYAEAFIYHKKGMSTISETCNKFDIPPSTMYRILEGKIKYKFIPEYIEKYYNKY